MDISHQNNILVEQERGYGFFRKVQQSFIKKLLTKNEIKKMHSRLSSTDLNLEVKWMCYHGAFGEDEAEAFDAVRQRWDEKHGDGFLFQILKELRK